MFVRTYRFLAVFQVGLLLCCVHTGYTDSVTVIPGNVTIAAIFSLNDLENYVCGDFDVDELQSLVGITWFVEAINAMNYVPGITIGLEVYRTCRIPGMATEGVAKLLNKYGVLTESTCISQEGVLFGMLGPSRTSEALQVSAFFNSLPANHRLVEISGSASGKQLGDKTLYPTFFRVIPPDDTQIRVLLELLLQLQWNYVAIVYDDDDYGRSAAEELRRLAEGRQICVPVFASVPVDARSEAFNLQATSISEKLKSSSKNGLVRGMVILGSASTTKHLQQALSKLITYVSLVLSEAVALNRANLLTVTGQVSTLTAGALVTSPPYIPVPELIPLWNSMWSNQTAFQQQSAKIPWLDDYFTQLLGCSANDPTCWQQAEQKRMAQMVQEGEFIPYMGYQVKAVAVLAALLKNLHSTVCGPSSTGVCPELKSEISQRSGILDLMRQSSFDLSVFSTVTEAFTDDFSVTFNATDGNVINDGMEAEFDVFNFRRDDTNDFRFEKIGSWKDQSLNINTSQAQFYDDSQSPLTWSQLPPAQCQVDHDCVTCERDVSKDVIFVEGDFYVIGIVPVNDKDTDDLLSCGVIKPLAGADIAQSLLFAVDEVNKKNTIFKDVLPGRKVGLVVLNSCGSPLVVRQRLMDLLGGTLALPGGRTSSSILYNVMGYVGAYFSANSIAASETLNTFNRPFVQVSAASTSPDLSDTKEHPYFLRLPAADDKQAQALLDIVQTLGANYIQIIYDSSTAYAVGLLKKLQDDVTSSTYNVCIAQSIAITPKDANSQEYIRIANELKQKYSAKIVILLLHLVEIEKVMDATLPQLETSEFFFLASESWGRRNDVLKGRDRTKLAGTLVLSQDIVIDQFFQRYFRELDPDPAASMNPWLKYFWEARLNCYFSTSFLRKGKPELCPEDVADSYVQEPRIPFHINAVYALVLGFNAAFAQHCGSLDTRICEALTSSALFSAMVRIKLDLYGTGQPAEIFESNGDGLVGYSILQISRDLSTADEDVMYKRVGSWSQKQLNLDWKELYLLGDSNFRSVCPNDRECNACFLGQQDNSSSSANDEEAKQISLAAFVSIVVVLVIIIGVLIAVVVILIRRLKSKTQDKNVRPRTDFTNVVFREDVMTDSNYHTIDHQSTIPPLPRRCEPVLPPDYLHAVAGTEVNTQQAQQERTDA